MDIDTLVFFSDELTKVAEVQADSRKITGKDVRDVALAGGATMGAAKLLTPAAERLLGAQRYIYATDTQSAKEDLRYGLDYNPHIYKDNIYHRIIDVRPEARIRENLAERYRKGEGTLDKLIENRAIMPKNIVDHLVGDGRGSVVGGVMPHEDFAAAFTPSTADWFTFQNTKTLEPKDLRKGSAGLIDVVKARSKNIPKYLSENKGRVARGAVLGGLSLGLGGLAVNRAKAIYSRKKAPKPEK